MWFNILKLLGKIFQVILRLNAVNKDQITLRNESFWPMHQPLFSSSTFSIEYLAQCADIPETFYITLLQY